MVIREMSRDECLRLLGRSRLARLACAQGKQPYVIPVYLAYHERSRCLYGFTTPGKKIAWMRANPLVCVEVDEVAAHDRWVSVVATGHYEELPHAAQGDGSPARMPERSGSPPGVVRPRAVDDVHHHADDERRVIGAVLRNLPEWWQPGSAVWAARAHRDPAAPFVSVFYRIRLDEVTGHAATPDAGIAIPHAAPVRQGWLYRTITRLFRRQPEAD
jgi:nitroimidazol reductase NimA-like FMN-containing flavoprotein (pyridoxamine 5'-phosphate oxidase superfamily)